MARLAGAGHGVESPGALTCLRVVRIDEAAHSIFAPRDTHNDLVFHKQRSNRKHIGLPIVGRLHIPDDIPGFPVECQHVRVKRRHEQFVAQRRKTPIHHAAAGLDLFRQAALVAPDRSPCASIQSEGSIVLSGAVEHPVDHQGRRLKLA